MSIDMDEKFLNKMINDKFDALDNRQPDIVETFTAELMEKINLENYSVESLVRANITGKVERKVKSKAKHVPEDNRMQSEFVGMDGDKWLESGMYCGKEFVKNRHANQKDNRKQMGRVDDHFEIAAKARHTESKRFIMKTELYEKHPTAENNGEAIKMELAALADLLISEAE